MSDTKKKGRIMWCIWVVFVAHDKFADNSSVWQYIDWIKKGGRNGGVGNHNVYSKQPRIQNISCLNTEWKKLPGYLQVMNTELACLRGSLLMHLSFQSPNPVLADDYFKNVRLAIPKPGNGIWSIQAGIWMAGCQWNLNNGGKSLEGDF